MAHHRMELQMKYGHIALEEANWHQATMHFDNVLGIDSEYAPAYIGKLCAELRMQNEALLGSCKETISEHDNFQKAVQFADGEYKTKIEGYVKKTPEHTRQEQKHDENQKKNTKNKERIENQTAVTPTPGTVGVPHPAKRLLDYSENEQGKFSVAEEESGWGGLSYLMWLVIIVLFTGVLIFGSVNANHAIRLEKRKQELNSIRTELNNVEAELARREYDVTEQGQTERERRLRAGEQSLREWEQRLNTRERELNERENRLNRQEDR